MRRSAAVYRPIHRPDPTGPPRQGYHLRWSLDAARRPQVKLPTLRAGSSSAGSSRARRVHGLDPSSEPPVARRSPRTFFSLLAFTLHRRYHERKRAPTAIEASSTVSTGNKGSGTGATGGTPEDASAAALAELVTRLQAHSESLRRDIRRLQRALSEINGAMVLSLDRVERLRTNTERLRSIFGTGSDDLVEGTTRRERRSGADRRSGLDRRRDAMEVAGLMRWIEGTSLDRRKGGERRSPVDRRQHQDTAPQQQIPFAARRRASLCSGQQRSSDQEEDGHVVSLADYRKSRKAQSKPKA